MIYPVYVPDLSALRGYKQVKDGDTLTITVTLKSKEITTPYTGKDTLFGAPVTHTMCFPPRKRRPPSRC